jgi:predicted peptidase
MKPRFSTCLLSIAALMIAVSASFAQHVETGFLNRVVKIGPTEYRYVVYLPREFTRKETWPVIVALHGGGEYGSDGMRHTNVGLAPAIRRNPERFPAIVIFPQAKADGAPGWQLEGGTAAIAALDRSIKEFRGDPTRVILTGYSAGGNGTWSIASRYPERFAAIVPVCSFVTRFTGVASKVEYPPLAPAGADPHGYVAQKVSKLPVWMFHGDADKTVLPDDSRKMFAALKAIGANVRYSELPGVNHNAWDPAYGNAELIDWMLRQRRRSEK